MSFNAKWARDTAMASLPEHADLLEDIYETILDAVLNHELGVVITADRFPDVVVSHLTEQGFSVSSGATSQVISWAAAIDGAPKPPSVPLTLVSTDPDNGASEVNELGTITFTFDRELDADASEAFAEISGLTGDNEGVEVDGYSVAGSTLSVALNRNIVENGDDITVHLRSGSVTADDDGGSQLDDVATTFTMHTFVPDPLTLSSTTPSYGSTEVMARNTVAFTFSRALATGVTTTATLTGLTGDNEGITNSVAVSGSTVTVTLSRALAENGDTVTVQLNGATLEAADGGTVSGNPSTEFTMHTFVPDPLELVSTTPTNGATEVAARNTVTFDFDKPLALEVTSNATITGADGVTVADTAVNGSSVVVTLSEPLSEDGSTVTVTLPAGAVTAQDGGAQDSAATTAFTMAEPEPEDPEDPEEPEDPEDP